MQVNTAYAFSAGTLTINSPRQKTRLDKLGNCQKYEILPIHMSIDHRFVEGALAARLLKRITFYFNNPSLLNIDEKALTYYISLIVFIHIMT